MTRGSWALVALVAIGAAGIWLARATSRPNEARPTSPRSVERAVAIRAMGVDADPRDMSAVLAANDRLREEHGWATEEDVREYVFGRLREVEVTDEEQRQTYEENRALFGRRTFEQSQASIERLLRIRKVRAELEGVP